jgi:AmmeMemoRadiSam system protein A
MAVTPSTKLDAESKALLLDTAAEAIESALSGAASAPPELASTPAALRENRACFVTLNTGGELRGCVGSIEAHRPLIFDVWHNARAAAFHDPRFLPLRAEEWPQTDLEISVLSPMRQVAAEREEDLTNLLRPGQDGLVLAFGEQRATFLPKVWEQIPDARQFVRRLKQKAGLPADFWRATARAWLYDTESFSRRAVSRS